METGQQLAQRFLELFEGKWIANTNYQEQLAGISWQQSIQQIGAFNSIAALTFHIRYYINGLNEVFAGGDLTIRDQYSFDLPEISSEADWEQLREALFSSAATFSKHLEQMTIQQLEGPFVKEQYGSYRRNIEGIIEHGYYHLGQVVLVRKMILVN